MLERRLPRTEVDKKCITVNDKIRPLRGGGIKGGGSLGKPHTEME